MLAVFERLAQRVEYVPLEFGQLIQEQDVVGCQAHLAGQGNAADPERPGIEDRVASSGLKSL